MSLLLSLWLYHAHITPAMIKTNTGQQGEEKETTRETKSGSRFKGGGAQTEEEWVRQADIHLHRGPSNKMQIMGKDCVWHRQSLWVCVLEVNPCGWVYDITDKGQWVWGWGQSSTSDIIQSVYMCPRESSSQKQGKGSVSHCTRDTFWYQSWWKLDQRKVKYFSQQFLQGYQG